MVLKAPEYITATNSASVEDRMLFLQSGKAQQKRRDLTAPMANPFLRHQL